MTDAATIGQLQVLQRQYFQLVEPHSLNWLGEDTLKQPAIQAWMFHGMFDAESVKSPPPDRYQLRVLKMLISKLERAIKDPEEDGISDDLMSAMSSLLFSNVPSEADSAQQKAYVTYAFPDRSTNDSTSHDRTVTLLEARSVISSSGTTGLRTWEAALLLGSYFASPDGQTSIQGKRVFELGAGTGVLSILCAKYLGIAAIVATDGDEAVVDAIKTNFFLNALDIDDSSHCVVRTAALKWGWPIDATTFHEDYGMEAPDVLVGADVTYDKSVIPRLVTTLREFFELNPALRVLISATIRNEETFETFLLACKRNGFNIVQLDFPTVPEHHQDGPFFPTHTPIQIWCITIGRASKNPFSI
ncbi:putative methyltransferase-domain-containing protein [Phaeosphaeria sp. MPI-PUGE-AT-0046c]|nr:putative methyltransferase-domain-containing protein [Phaeosphaeria sp. MPI-PUGE-AT-0046c]